MLFVSFNISFCVFTLFDIIIYVLIRKDTKNNTVMYGKMKEYLQQELESIKEAGLYKTERVICSHQRAEIEVGGRTVLNFCANNYLGLSDNKRLIEAAKAAHVHHFIKTLPNGYDSTLSSNDSISAGQRLHLAVIVPDGKKCSKGHECC